MRSRLATSSTLATLSALACLPLAGCFVPKDATPQLALGVDLDSKFVHRGQTMVDKPVLRPSMSASLPTTLGGDLGGTVEANMDLVENTGNAWFPSGHSGKFTQIELIGDYTQTFGEVTMRAGIHSYNLPNGLEFKNGERGGTTEAFTTFSANVLEATPYLSLHYDFDEVRAGYWRAGLTESFDLGEGFSLTGDGSLGYAASSQSAWIYGIDEAGFADLRGRLQLDYLVDERTTISAAINGSTIVDGTIADWLDQIGIHSDVIWFSVGVGWSF